MIHKKHLVIHAYDLDTTDTTPLECRPFTTLDVCCLFPIVICTSLFIFFYNSGWVLVISDCELDIPICFFYNSGWVLFIPDCHMAIADYFFTTLDGYCLFVIVIWTSLFIFFTTLDGCCSFPTVTWPLLFIFLQLWMGAVCF